MAEIDETLTVEYDPTNDVLRVLAVPYASDPIAVPTGGVFVLVSEGLDRVVGIVFPSYLPRIRMGLPEGSENVSDEALLQVSTSVMANIFPVLMRETAPLAKDAIAMWMAYAPRESD